VEGEVIMGAYAIFVCHDCKESAFAEGWINIKIAAKHPTWAEFSEKHMFHKISLQSCAHGQLKPEDFLEGKNDPNKLVP
jgi:hypothetical protein